METIILSTRRLFPLIRQFKEIFDIDFVGSKDL